MAADSNNSKFVATGPAAGSKESDAAAPMRKGILRVSKPTVNPADKSDDSNVKVRVGSSEAGTENIGNVSRDGCSGDIVGGAVPLPVNKVGLFSDATAAHAAGGGGGSKVDEMDLIDSIEASLGDYLSVKQKLPKVTDELRDAKQHDQQRDSSSSGTGRDLEGRRKLDMCSKLQFCYQLLKESDAFDSRRKSKDGSTTATTSADSVPDVLEQHGMYGDDYEPCVRSLSRDSKVKNEKRNTGQPLQWFEDPALETLSTAHYSDTLRAHVPPPAAVRPRVDGDQVLYDRKRIRYDDDPTAAGVFGAKRLRYPGDDDPRYARFENRMWPPLQDEMPPLHPPMHAPRTFVSCTLRDVGHRLDDRMLPGYERTPRYGDQLRAPEAYLKSSIGRNAAEYENDVFGMPPLPAYGRREPRGRPFVEEHHVHQSAFRPPTEDGSRIPLADDYNSTVGRSSLRGGGERKPAVDELGASREPRSTMTDCKDWGRTNEQRATSSLSLGEADVGFPDRSTVRSSSLHRDEVVQGQLGRKHAEWVDVNDAHISADDRLRNENYQKQDTVSFKLVRDFSNGKNVCELFMEGASLISFADHIAFLLRSITDLVVKNYYVLPNVDVIEQVESAVDRGTLFVILMTEESREKNSLSVYKLAGIEQEGHLNILVDDAVSLITVWYADYLISRPGGNEPPPAELVRESTSSTGPEKSTRVSPTRSVARELSSVGPTERHVSSSPTAAAVGISTDAVTSSTLDKRTSSDVGRQNRTTLDREKDRKSLPSGQHRDKNVKGLEPNAGRAANSDDSRRVRSGSKEKQRSDSDRDKRGRDGRTTTGSRDARKNVDQKSTHEAVEKKDAKRGSENPRKDSNDARDSADNRGTKRKRSSSPSNKAGGIDSSHGNSNVKSSNQLSYDNKKPHAAAAPSSSQKPIDTVGAAAKKLSADGKTSSSPRDLHGKCNSGSKPAQAGLAKDAAKHAITERKASEPSTLGVLDKSATRTKGSTSAGSRLDVAIVLYSSSDEESCAIQSSEQAKKTGRFETALIPKPNAISPGYSMPAKTSDVLIFGANVAVPKQQPTTAAAKTSEVLSSNDDRSLGQVKRKPVTSVASAKAGDMSNLATPVEQQKQKAVASRSSNLVDVETVAQLKQKPLTPMQTARTGEVIDIRSQVKQKPHTPVGSAKSGDVSNVAMTVGQQKQTAVAKPAGASTKPIDVADTVATLKQNPVTPMMTPRTSGANDVTKGAAAVPKQDAPMEKQTNSGVTPATRDDVEADDDEPKFKFTFKAVSKDSKLAPKSVIPLVKHNDAANAPQVPASTSDSNAANPAVDRGLQATRSTVRSSNSVDVGVTSSLKTTGSSGASNFVSTTTTSVKSFTPSVSLATAGSDCGRKPSTSLQTSSKPNSVTSKTIAAVSQQYTSHPSSSSSFVATVSSVYGANVAPGQATSTWSKPSAVSKYDTCVTASHVPSSAPFYPTGDRIFLPDYPPSWNGGAQNSALLNQQDPFMTSYPMMTVPPPNISYGIPGVMADNSAVPFPTAYNAFNSMPNVGGAVPFPGLNAPATYAEHGDLYAGNIPGPPPVASLVAPTHPPPPSFVPSTNVHGDIDARNIIGFPAITPAGPAVPDIFGLGVDVQTVAMLPFPAVPVDVVPLAFPVPIAPGAAVPDVFGLGVDVQTVAMPPFPAVPVDVVVPSDYASFAWQNAPSRAQSTASSVTRTSANVSQGVPDTANKVVPLLSLMGLTSATNTQPCTQSAASSVTRTSANVSQGVPDTGSKVVPLLSLMGLTSATNTQPCTQSAASSVTRTSTNVSRGVPDTGSKVVPLLSLMGLDSATNDRKQNAATRKVDAPPPPDVSVASNLSWRSAPSKSQSVGNPIVTTSTATTYASSQSGKDRKTSSTQSDVKTSSNAVGHSTGKNVNTSSSVTSQSRGKIAVSDVSSQSGKDNNTSLVQNAANPFSTATATTATSAPSGSVGDTTNTEVAFNLKRKRPRRPRARERVRLREAKLRQLATSDDSANQLNVYTATSQSSDVSSQSGKDSKTSSAHSDVKPSLSQAVSQSGKYSGTSSTPEDVKPSLTYVVSLPEMKIDTLTVQCRDTTMVSNVVKQSTGDCSKAAQSQSETRKSTTPVAGNKLAATGSVVSCDVRVEKHACKPTDSTVGNIPTVKTIHQAPERSAARRTTTEVATAADKEPMEIDVNSVDGNRVLTADVDHVGRRSVTQSVSAATRTSPVVSSSGDWLLSYKNFRKSVTERMQKLLDRSGSTTTAAAAAVAATSTIITTTTTASTCTTSASCSSTSASVNGSSVKSSRDVQSPLEGLSSSNTSAAVSSVTTSRDAFIDVVVQETIAAAAAWQQSQSRSDYADIDDAMVKYRALRDSVGERMLKLIAPNLDVTLMIRVNRNLSSTSSASSSSGTNSTSTNVGAGAGSGTTPLTTNAATARRVTHAAKYRFSQADGCRPTANHPSSSSSAVQRSGTNFGAGNAVASSSTASGAAHLSTDVDPVIRQAVSVGLFDGLPPTRNQTINYPSTCSAAQKCKAGTASPAIVGSSDRVVITVNRESSAVGKSCPSSKTIKICKVPGDGSAATGVGTANLCGVDAAATITQAMLDALCAQGNRRPSIKYPTPTSSSSNEQLTGNLSLAPRTSSSVSTTSTKTTTADQFSGRTGSAGSAGVSAICSQSVNSSGSIAESPAKYVVCEIARNRGSGITSRVCTVQSTCTTSTTTTAKQSGSSTTRMSDAFLTASYKRLSRSVGERLDRFVQSGVIVVPAERQATSLSADANAAAAAAAIVKSMDVRARGTIGDTGTRSSSAGNLGHFSARQRESSESSKNQPAPKTGGGNSSAAAASSSSVRSATNVGSKSFERGAPPAVTSRQSSSSSSSSAAAAAATGKQVNRPVNSAKVASDTRPKIRARYERPSTVRASFPQSHRANNDARTTTPGGGGRQSVGGGGSTFNSRAATWNTTGRVRNSGPTRASSDVLQCRWWQW